MYVIVVFLADSVELNQYSKNMPVIVTYLLRQFYPFVDIILREKFPRFKMEHAIKKLHKFSGKSKRILQKDTNLFERVQKYWK